MELNRSNIKKIIGIIAVSILLFIILEHMSLVMDTLRNGYRILSPILIGLCGAFILNVLLRLFEERIFGALARKNYKVWQVIHRPVCIVLTLVVVAGILFLVLFLLIPELKRTIEMLIANMPQYAQNIEYWSMNVMERFGLGGLSLSTIQIDWDRITNMVTSFLQNWSGDFLNTTVGVTTSIFSGLFNFILGIIFSVYLLAQKETLASQFQRVLHAFFPKRRVDRFVEICHLSNRIFSNFVSGQFLEAVIIGLLCFIGMKLFRFPYASMISVLVGFTALIPMFGAFIGTAIGAFLILMVSPMKALWFIVFIVVLQQLEGNIIYPRVVGSSIGLPGIWVLVAVVLGTSTLGVTGLLLGVPTCSVLYCLLREAVHKRLGGGVQPEESGVAQGGSDAQPDPDSGPRRESGVEAGISRPDARRTPPRKGARQRGAPKHPKEP